MSSNLYRRRPDVKNIAVFVTTAQPLVTMLDATSLLRFGQVCDAFWKYLDTLRQTDSAQPVADQIHLARIEMLVRRIRVGLTRYYPLASGSLRFYLTQDAQDSMKKWNNFDPAVSLTPSFSASDATARIVAGAYFR